MKKKILYIKILITLLLPLTILLFNLSSLNPYFIEKMYSNNLNKGVIQILSIITGVFPISIGEIIYVSIIIFLLYGLIRMIYKLIRTKKNYLKIIAHSFLNLMVFISILYFVFVFIWGFNYHRLPLSAIIGIDTNPATVKELETLCESLILEANELRKNVKENRDGIMIIPGRYNGFVSRLDAGYENISKSIPELGGTYGKPKPVFLSRVMSYAGISGMYFPFTGEANINIEIPDSMIPCTTYHEMAHQRGFAREDEANFIAYITCKSHPDTDIKYSGTLLALIYSMNSLYKYNPDMYNALEVSYSLGVSKDLNYINKFWNSYEGPIEDTSTKINNAYLKANDQESGVHSYGRMVDLLIAEYRKK